jgi:hypothetical protein
MALIYELAGQDVTDLAQIVMDRYHVELSAAGVKLGILMVRAVDKDGNISGKPPLKGLGGKATGAQMGNVKLKDRLTKHFDVEIVIDAEGWKQYSEAAKIALLDHEMTHILLTGEQDDLGRPQTKMREDTWVAWGFFEIMEKHGDACSEVACLKRLMGMDVVRKTVLGG